MATPHALQPQPRPSAREVEAKRLRQEALKEQEEQEERLLKKRKKVSWSNELEPKWDSSADWIILLSSVQDIPSVEGIKASLKVLVSLK